jgi:uncharacterized membrane protein
MNGEGRTRKRLWWALAVSLTLNGLFIGWAVSAYFMHEPPRRGTLSLELRSVGDNLPVADREALRDSVKEMLPELRERWQKLRSLRREVNLLAAEAEPDRAEIDARLAEIREISASIQEMVQKRLFDEALALPPESRARLRETPEPAAKPR